MSIKVKQTSISCDICDKRDHLVLVEGQFTIPYGWNFFAIEHEGKPEKGSVQLKCRECHSNGRIKPQTNIEQVESKLLDLFARFKVAHLSPEFIKTEMRKILNTLINDNANAKAELIKEIKDSFDIEVGVNECDDLVGRQDFFNKLDSIIASVNVLEKLK